MRKERIYFETYEEMSTPVTEIKVGDVISVNTGYRPFDDEDCEVLDIAETVDVFGENTLAMELRTPSNEIIHTTKYIHGQYGNKPKFIWKVLRKSTLKENNNEHGK